MRTIMKHTEKREEQRQALQQETLERHRQLVELWAKCRDPSVTKRRNAADGRSSVVSVGLAEMILHLKDAEQNNVRWMRYDRQREEYVRVLLDRMNRMQGQLNQATKAVQQREREEEDGSEEQQYWGMQRGRKVQEQQKRWWEMTDPKKKTKWNRVEESRPWRKHLARPHDRLHISKCRFHDRLRSFELRDRPTTFELQQQVKLLQKSLVNTDELQNRLATLERQVRASTRELEEERRVSFQVQQQLCKVLKALRKAKDEVERLELEAAKSETSISGSGSESEEENMAPIRGMHGFLEEKVLECPSCGDEYPSTHYRDLLRHVECCV